MIHTQQEETMRKTTRLLPHWVIFGRIHHRLWILPLCRRLYHNDNDAQDEEEKVPYYRPLPNHGVVVAPTKHHHPVVVEQRHFVRESQILLLPWRIFTIVYFGTASTMMMMTRQTMFGGTKGKFNGLSFWKISNTDNTDIRAALVPSSERRRRRKE